MAPRGEPMIDPDDLPWYCWNSRHAHATAADAAECPRHEMLTWFVLPVLATYLMVPRHQQLSLDGLGHRHRPSAAVQALTAELIRVFGTPAACKEELSHAQRRD